MRYNVDHATDKLALVAQALGVNITSITERDAALAAADAVEDLMKKVGHPMRLRDVGVPEENLAICAFHAIADTAVLFNGRPVNDPNDVLQIYTQAY
jgi:alcohol dehydrogenase class IV